ncbi:hypothetical protein J40TS1_43800 [Paenibacillus montaniterrae]|uniref:Xylose isomerase-like TIM barrel domain-containing protein n=1 Tax=Paenibacillus montaniterrae TaxID=429341 RepID=A0A919YXS7_9BACL|nr:TIM barrel protein [Paenibacillus montaniterrae]GIP18738.1 hypothetical protein J40TS1_43800 [Paenibacillus montaniterrae]
MLRLGGQVFLEDQQPELWAQAMQRAGFRAATCPFDGKDRPLMQEYLKQAERSDIVIAEVGAWSNPISLDQSIAQQAISYCAERLQLADEIGARVCVNIAGSRGTVWDGPHELNLSEDTFALIVDTVRAIIDQVKPTRAKYALEMMPWVYPNSADSYLRLLQAIDRPQFAVHFDPVNIINSPDVYYYSDQLITDFIQKLGAHIVNVHAKDVYLQPKLTLHLDEVVPGRGNLRYDVLLRQLHALQRDIPVIIEHLSTNEQVAEAAAYIRSVAAAHNISL